MLAKEDNTMTTPDDAVLYDKRGIPIAVGDVLKVYHFTAALRRKRHYMYKQVMGTFEGNRGGKYLKISHLNFVQDGYMERLNGSIRQDIEIVQSIKGDHEDRPRRNPGKER